jgi:hypothetical protein
LLGCAGVAGFARVAWGFDGCTWVVVERTGFDAVFALAGGVAGGAGGETVAAVCCGDAV